MIGWAPIEPDDEGVQLSFDDLAGDDELEAEAELEPDDELSFGEWVESLPPTP